MILRRNIKNNSIFIYGLSTSIILMELSSVKKYPVK